MHSVTHQRLSPLFGLLFLLLFLFPEWGTITALVCVDLGMAAHIVRRARLYRQPQGVTR